MTSLDNKISLNIDDIGVLEITYKKLQNKNKQLCTEISCLQFLITLKSNIKLKA